MDQAGSVGSATRQAWPCRAELARTLTGKFGWTWENLLATFRGGWAMGGGRHGPLGLDCSPLRPDRQPPRPAAAQTGSRPDRQPPRPAAAQTGSRWSVGVSIEYALRDHIIIGAESDDRQCNADGTLTSTGVGPLMPIHLHAGVDIQAARRGSPCQFGGGWGRQRTSPASPRRMLQSRHNGGSKVPGALCLR
jgi:hypothetical protein